jgi:PKD repeat protein
LRNSGGMIVTISFGSNKGHLSAAVISIFVVALMMAGGCSSSTNDSANHPPVAHPKATPAVGPVPLTVVFDAVAFDTDGSIASYTWAFGDDATSTLASPTHIYKAIGTFTATVIVTDNDGAATQASVNVVVHVPANVPPTANPSATPTLGTAPLLVSFTGAGTDSDGTIASYAWTFGDGGTSTLKNPTHTYASPNSYTATLTVTDNDGATGSADVVITVNAPSNQAPTANAGPDQINRDPGITIFLNGNGSSDPDGTITSYQWTQIAGPGVTLSGANTGTPSFFAPSSTTASYTFRLTVTDNGSPQLNGQDSVTVTTRVTYLNTTKSIFDSRCVSCHFTGSSRVPLDNYSSIDSNSGTVRAKIQVGGTMRQYLTVGEANIITSWIDAGAPQTN